MILTNTANPSLDLTFKFDHLYLGEINRTRALSKTAGGRGINVARVLKDLGADVKVTGFLGGYTGQFIEDKLKDSGISLDFVPISAENRHCVIILHDEEITRVREYGPSLTENDEEKFIEKYDSLLNETRVSVIAGSIPNGISKNFYNRMIKRAQDQGVFTILCTNNRYLEETLVYKEKPDCLVLSQEEAENYTGRRMTDEELSKVFQSASFKNIPIVFIALDRGGMACKYHENTYFVSPPSVEMVNPVGSEDALAAGLAYGIDRGLSDKQVIQAGATCYYINDMEKESAHINLLAFSSIASRILISNLNAYLESLSD